MLNDILTFLDGKKAIIFGIASAVLSYLVAGSIIDKELGALIQTILTLLSGGAVYATNQVLGSRRRI
jgi:hypothetical protein